MYFVSLCIFSSVCMSALVTMWKKVALCGWKKESGAISAFIGCNSQWGRWPSVAWRTGEMSSAIYTVTIMARHLKICVQGFWRNHVCISQDKNIYVEDWGEGLVGKSCPVLCVADLNKGAVIVYAGVPPHISPGQVSQMYITILICLMDNQLCYTIHGKCISNVSQIQLL